MTPPCHSLFVYGTLRRRCRHPMAIFLASRGEYLGEAKTAGQLFDLGPYPGALPAVASEEWIFGDLYRIDEATLAVLDDYENAESPQPSYFGRQVSPVLLPGGATQSAWIYWFHGPLPPTARLIASGQYEKTFETPGV